MPRNNIINPHDHSNEGIPLWSSTSRNCLIRKDIIARNNQLIDAMTSKHVKTFFFRLDIRFPEGYPVELKAACQMLSRFFKFYMHALVEYYGRIIDPHYRRKLELNPGATLPHAHAFVLLNGKQAQHIFYPMNIAESVWNSILGGKYSGTVDWCRQEKRQQDFDEEHYCDNGIVLNRNSPDFADLLFQCKRWASYLSKLDGTEGLPPYTHIHDGSQF